MGLRPEVPLAGVDIYCHTILVVLTSIVAVILTNFMLRIIGRKKKRRP